MNVAIHWCRARQRLLPIMGPALFACACVDTVSTQPLNVTRPAVSTEAQVAAALPDVSVQKCIDDGFDVAEIYNASGVPESYICVDRQHGQKCESWAYYRGECALGAGWNTQPGIAPTSRESSVGHASKCPSHEQPGDTKRYNQSVTGGGCP